MNNLDELIPCFENNQSEEIINSLNLNGNLLELKTTDGWRISQLAAFYNNQDVFNRVCELGTIEQINCSDNHNNPLLIAIDENNFDFIINAVKKHKDKLNLNAKEKGGENLLQLAVLKKQNELSKTLFDSGVSCFDKSNNGESAISQAIQNGDVTLFDYFNELSNLRDNYDELFIKKSIQFDNDTLLNRLLPLSRIDRDELFNLACGFGSVKSLNAIMQSGEVLPGKEQINKIIDLITKKYEHAPEEEAAASLANYLFEIKIPFNQFVNSLGQSAWMLCIQNNNTAVFEMLMNSSENVNVSDTEQHSPLFYAIERGNLNIVRTLLKKKANPNHKDRNNSTPLLKAVELGNVDIVRELLKYTYQVNEVNNQNESAMTVAIKKRRMDILADLIWSGGEITTNPVKHIEEKQMFHFGSNGHTDRYSYHEEEQIDNFVALSKLGLRLDQTNGDGDSFLLHFIKNGYMENFSALMRCQVNVNQLDNNGNNALMCAAMKKQDEYFNAIIRRFNNIDFNVTNNNNENIYDICFKNHKTKRLQEIIKIDKQLSFDKIKNPLKMIAKDGDFEAIEEIISSKISKDDLNFIDEAGNNLLMYCLAGGNLKNFKFLIEKDCDLNINRENKFGNSIRGMIESLPNSELKASLNSIISKKTKKP